MSLRTAEKELKRFCEETGAPLTLVGPSKFKEGMRVKARWDGVQQNGKYFSGSVDRVHEDGSCTIIYDDGTEEIE